MSDVIPGLGTDSTAAFVGAFLASGELTDIAGIPHLETHGGASPRFLSNMDLKQGGFWFRAFSFADTVPHGSLGKRHRRRSVRFCWNEGALQVEWHGFMLDGGDGG